MAATPVPRFPATLGILALVCIAATFYGARDIVTWGKGLGGSPSSPPPTRTATAATEPQRVAVTITGLGRSPVSRFAFDPAVAGRVVACDAESRDGGRSWPPLEADPMRRAMLLGGPKAAPPVAGPEGRILCGDAILPGPNGPNGLGDIHAAAEWTGSGWQSVGLPAAAPDGTDTTLDEAVGYDAQGQPIAVRADRLRRRRAHCASGPCRGVCGRRIGHALRRGHEHDEAHDADVGGGARRAVDGRAGARARARARGRRRARLGCR